MFAEGRGIATARALIESGTEECGLNLPMRQDVRLYYRVRMGGVMKQCWHAPPQLSM